MILLRTLLTKLSAFFVVGTALMITFSGCMHSPQSDTPRPSSPTSVVQDEYSYAEPHRVAVKHLSLGLQIDFTQKVLEGSATLHLEWKDPAATSLILDTRDLTIHRVEAAIGLAWQEVPFEISGRHPVLGHKLRIDLGRQRQRVRIGYRTSPSASGLQWLSPSMTLGKQQPFMFSQSQQIHARSWVPLQDTPQVRFTYDAQVRSSRETMVLMSADNNRRAIRDGSYTFQMPQPIPSYLLAIAAGDLVFQPITEQIGVWAEPGMASRAAEEFADTGRMMEAAETLYGPYRWGRYDILVLPPSFPYGGMENPRLTFVSPTVVTGDRSLVALIAHELAHSWSGNLVTFATPRDMWLNEGFTTYVEGRIIEALYGLERSQIDKTIDRAELKMEFTDANRALQVLALPPGAIEDPDDYLRGTVYTKGAWFLDFLEERFGRSSFDTFLRSYFDHFAFRPVSTTDFKEYATRHLLEAYPGKVSEAEFHEWIHESGLPASAPQISSRRLDAVSSSLQLWLNSGTLPASALTSSWTTQEWIHFLEGLPAVLSEAQLRALDEAYRFTGTGNGEIAQRWYPLAVRSGYKSVRPAIAEFLARVGRRKLVLPIYKALVGTPEGLAFAREVLARSRDNLHPITVGSIDDLLNGKAARH